MLQQRDKAGTTGPCGTLMIVEDEPLLAMQMSRALEDYGWAVLGVAGSLDEASDLLSHNDRPDVAILDVDLLGKAVFPFARTLRTLDVPFVFCTGYDNLDHVDEFAACQTIRKPATVFQILHGLRDAVGDSRTGLPA